MEALFLIVVLIVIVFYRDKILNYLDSARTFGIVFIYRMMPSNNSIEIKEYEKYMIVEYTFNHDRQRLYIPVDKLQAPYASGCMVYAHYGNRKELIKQLDTIPLMITANMLGADYIQVCDMNTFENRLFHGDEIPDYY